MQSVQYKTKTGVMQYRPTLDEGEELSDYDNMGFCLACGAEASGVEPDARRYTCESCNAAKVFGLEELALMGLFRMA